MAPLVLCACETWSHTLREEHRLRVFEHKVLRRISGPIRQEDGENLIIINFII
jgi:hypothetical protein